MEKELDPEVIKATQNSLGKYVKRPPLSEKLLKKPPFRFLHDIVTTVLKTTGFFEGLFDPEELISDNVKDRDSKILFLNKVVSVLGTTTGQTLSVKPSKIVAGQEPEKTNQLLQCLAQTLDKKLSSDEAVKKYKESSKLTKPTEKKSKEQSKPAKKDTTDVKKLTTKNNERLINHKRDTSERSLTRNDSKDRTNVSKVVKQKENSHIKKESPPKKITQETKPNIKKNKVEKPQEIIESVKHQNKNNIVAIISDHEKNTNDDKEDEDSGLPQESQDFMDSTITFPKIETKLEEDQKQQFDASYTIAENDLNSSLSSQDLMEVKNDKSEVKQVLEKDVDSSVKTENKVDDNLNNSNKIVDEQGIKVGVISNDKANVNLEQRKLKSFSSFGSNNSESESVAKDTEDRNQDNVKKSTVRPTSVRPSSSRPGAPRLREKHENVLNSTDNLLIGKVNIIVENGHNEEEEDTSIVIVEQQSNPPVPHDQDQLQLSSTQHGHLVQQILDSQKEFSQNAGKTEIEWQFGAQKAREALNQEIEQLRFNIQGLSRAANPLGKLLDHIQEDVEVMRQELQQWTTSYEEASKELVKQKTANEESLFPLHTKLKQLNADIEEKRDKINDLKIVIHKNSNRIEKLLAGGNVQ